VADRLIPCVGAIIRDDRGRLLVVRRGREPGRGLWSVPGGRVEPGESAERAVVREVVEETGLEVEVLRHVGSVRRPAPHGGTFDIHDYLVRVVGASVPVAGDDADEVAWVTRSELAARAVVPGLWEALEAWSLLPEG
jgi:mutator protein MutT